MGTTALRQLLMSLCNNLQWKYAVFWKLEHRSRMQLIWEDGFCDYVKPGEPIQSFSDDFNSTNDIFSSKCETTIHNGSYGGYPIGVALADMSCLQYALGEGVVGKVAYTGNHCWFSSDSIIADEFNSELVPKCPDEWLLQFAAGIKTVLLVPVVPHGVLQLGSFETVAEDLMLVAYIKDRFNALQNGFPLPFTFNKGLLAQSSSPAISFPMENLDESSTITNGVLNKMQSEDKSVDIFEASNNRLSTTNQVTPLFTVQDALQASGKVLPDILNGESENEISVLPVGFIELSTPLNRSLNANHSEMMKNNLSRFSCLEEESPHFTQCSNYNVGVFGEFPHGTMDSYFDGDIMGQFYGDWDAIDTNYTGVSSFFSFPTDCELHKALGQDFRGRTNEFLWQSSISGKDACSGSSLICNGDLISCIEPSAWESRGWSAKRGDAEHLLEAVVAKVYNCSDDTSSNRSNSVRSSTTLLGQFTASSQAQSQSEKSALSGDDSVLRSHVTSAFAASGRNAFANSSTSGSSFKSVMSRLIDDQKQNKGYPDMQARMGAKLSNVSKRRARPVDKQRPRPRDRQLIQDRVKELRELVPNGAKCSIDGLLDQTIKHMLFLRGVTDRAEKLRQCMHQEVAGGMNWKSSETKSASQNGTSWAFQLGSELEVCPIVVEDLEYPGHMLIEMLCNENGLFLEIAQVIRRLELTILEGMMKSRSNSMWAHFIVEVSRGFHRMDIFWPLMQLLQRNRNPISSKI